MSLLASLTTDCGGLLNRRSHGRKRCCHMGLFTRDIMFALHTDRRGGHGLFTRMVLVPNLRIVEFFFTRSIAESHGVLSRIIELSNFFSHGESRRFSLSQDMFLVTNLRIIEFLSSRGMSRMVTDVYLEFSFLYRDLSFGPTGQREVIIELVYFHTEHRGESRFYCPETCPWTH